MKTFIDRRVSGRGAAVLIALVLASGCDSDPATTAEKTPAASSTKTDGAEPSPASAPTKASTAPTEADEDDSLEGFDPKVVQAAMLARSIEAKPEEADLILASAELDRAALDALMVEIARDPALTEQYRVARGL